MGFCQWNGGSPDWPACTTFMQGLGSLVWFAICMMLAVLALWLVVRLIWLACRRHYDKADIRAIAAEEAIKMMRDPVAYERCQGWRVDRVDK